MPSCDDCGQVHKDIHGLQAHVKEWCSWLKRRKVDDDDVSVQKRICLDEEQREREALEDIMGDAEASNRPRWLEKYKSYVKAGTDKREAIRRAETSKANDIKMFVKKYGNAIHNVSLLQNGRIHERVLKSVEEFIQAGMTERKAISMAIKNNKHLLEFIWSTTEDTDDSDMDDNSDDDSAGDDDIKSDDDIEVSDNDDDDEQFKIEKILRTKGVGNQKKMPDQMVRLAFEIQFLDQGE